MTDKETEELNEHIANSLTLLSDYFNQENLTGVTVIDILQSLLMHSMRCCFVPKYIVKKILDELAEKYEFPLVEETEE